MPMMLPLLVLAAGLAQGFAAGAPPDLGALERGFQRPPDDARVMMRWWWFGPAVTTTGLEREMRLMKAGGIGGFEVQPVYPLALDDPARGIRNLTHLSEEFLEALRFTAAKARELGLRFDLTLGSGWPYGGPSVPVTEAAGRLRWERVPVTASSRIPLPGLAGGDKLITAFGVRARGQGAPVEVLGELADIRDGAVWIPAGGDRAAGVWCFISSRTRQLVKRPAPRATWWITMTARPSRNTSRMWPIR